MSSEISIPEIAQRCDEIRSLLNQYVVGKDSLIELINVALLSDGHILIEGVPGTAKTTIAKAYAKILGYSFNRVQCAVDTQPADILGLRIYDQQKGEFVLRKGPAFANILLIDELNRLNPRTQSAFIEVMSERQVTIEGDRLSLPSPFFVMATQNPYEFEGTFPLIEAQKDRFMYSFTSEYLNPDEELEVLVRLGSGRLDWEKYFAYLEEHSGKADIFSLRDAVTSVHIEERVAAYIRDLVVATRSNGDISLGASTRASIAFYKGSKAVAALRGRDFVTPDDVRTIAPNILQHRMILRREAEIAGITLESVVSDIIRSVEVP
ncbi:ATPase [Methanocalculus chunghsingensis]|uniref:ATPase n=1 Tax=Methanocalculus chunghsingensis TaxID=156457 RepID=A0A8J7W9L5_9EURY|nr:MoxR family ATPase [Methanocalculus chunghsingensis]MBR1368855.1 ATPase [Methanocalculus chunghsingensis]